MDLGDVTAERLREKYGDFLTMNPEHVEQKLVPLISEELCALESQEGVEFGDLIKWEAVHFVLRSLQTIGCISDAHLQQARVLEQKQNMELLDRIKNRQ